MANPEQAAAAGAAAATTDATGLLDQIVSKGFRPEGQEEAQRAKSYLDEFVSQIVHGKVVSKEVMDNIEYWIAQIDKKLTVQLNEVLHNPEFQRLEATWRGLHYLVHNSETGTELKIRVMNATKKELAKDMEKASRFDLSNLFKRIYEEEYGTLGGEPYGMMVADYEFGRGAEDIGLLDSLAKLAASAHAPLITNPSPKLFGWERFTQLSDPATLGTIFDKVEYAKWKSFRESEDSRYVGLAMPKVLGRLPYGSEFKQVAEFNFEEFVDGKDHDKYLWMGAAWAYAARVTAAYAEDGWFARTRGVEGGGKVEGLPVHTFPTDDGDVAMKCPTEIAITDRREYELSNLGFLPLVHAKGRDFAAFIGAQSAQKPKTYFDPLANANAELSTKLNYIMCVSRFAHYLKVMARDKLGSFMEVKDCERWLNDWINNFVCDPALAGDKTKAQKPLAAANVEVRETKGKPGHYEAIAYLRPHFQLESLTTSMRLVAEVPKKK
jgi:type VI secretion system protein ImpC